MNLKALLLLTLICILPSKNIAQNKLLIGKPGKPSTYEYHEGEMLRFKLKGEKYWNKGYIQGLYGDKIRMHYNTISLDEIAYIDIRDRGKGQLLYTVSWVGIRGGAGFAAIAQINKTFVAGEPGLEKTAIGIGGAIAVGGIIVSLFKKRKVRLGKKYKLRIGEI